jgi:hypothetical protein
MSTELLVAAVSFVAAVVAVVVGQLLGGFVDRREQERKWARSERDRHRTEGEAAAGAVLDAIIELDLGPFSIYKALQRMTKPTDNPSPRPSQAELEPFLARIRRNGLVVDEPRVRDVVRLAASLLGEYDSIANWTDTPTISVWWDIREDSEAVLGAYLRAEPIPETPRLSAFKDESRSYTMAVLSGDKAVWVDGI